MAVERRMQFVRAQTGIMLAAVICLALLDTLSLQSFFLVAFLGFLFMVEVTAPLAVAPRWRRRLRRVVVVGFLVLLVVVLARIVEVLSWGVF